VCENAQSDENISGPAGQETVKPVDRTTAYARAVVAGETIAGPHVRDACARHLRDLEHGAERGLSWHPERADKFFRFCRDNLRLNGGQHEGAPFELLDWQAFVQGSIFGWAGPDGFRRFRVAYIETAKGSGKSPTAAATGLYCLAADGEPRAEVYAAASKKDQAQILFRDAVAMVDQSPALTARIRKSGGKGREFNLAYLRTGSFFRTIASEDGQSGPRPHCALLDEIHEHRDNVAVEMMRAGTKGRRQALIYMITNSGADRTSVCYQYHEYAKKVCAGTLDDDAFFAYVCALEPGDDPFKDESCWGRANPSLGHTFGLKYLRELVTQASGMPSKEAIVRRLNFCEWTDAATPWIDRDRWESCEVAELPPDLAGTPCYGGLDLSAKRDLTAFAAVWKLPDDGLVAAVWFWTPGDTMDERAKLDNVGYRAWSDAGFLFAPPGRIIDKAYVAQHVQHIAGTNDMRALAFDQAQIEDFQRAADEIGFETWIDDRDRDDKGTPDGPEGEGLRMVRHGQGYAGFASKKVLWMPRSVNELEARIMAGPAGIRILINPVLRWNSASAVLAADATNNRRWDKRKATGRIDGMLALTMAVGAATAPEPTKPRSIWDDPELWDE
jgi:phage terminase large subunit-like protein